ncbi:hypothetical protein AYI70_g2730 [Smittium culicis]|uniref:Uncharacterized protein n=1 Tax=Smittium culicis TaxID=133412 RepID=A0A1R1Y730_9FUNG|nr:hypothetical protein AYI70_g2730 [Smittium culicis]
MFKLVANSNLIVDTLGYSNSQIFFKYIYTFSIGSTSFLEGATAYSSKDYQSILINMYESQSMIVLSLQSSLGDWFNLCLSSLQKAIYLLNNASIELSHFKPERFKAISNVLYNISSRLFKTKNLDMSLKFVKLSIDIDFEKYDNCIENSKKTELIGAIYHDLKIFNKSSYWLSKSIAHLLKHYLNLENSKSLLEFFKNSPTESLFWLNFQEKGKANKIENIFQFHSNMLFKNPILSSPKYQDQVQISTLFSLTEDSFTSLSTVEKKIITTLAQAIIDEIQYYYIKKQDSNYPFQRYLIMSAISKYKILESNYKLDVLQCKLRCFVDLSSTEIALQNLDESSLILNNLMIEFGNENNWYFKYQLCRAKLDLIISTADEFKISKYLTDAIKTMNSIKARLSLAQIVCYTTHLSIVTDYLSSKLLLGLELIALEHGHFLTLNANFFWDGSLFLVLAYIKTLNIDAAKLLIDYIQSHNLNGNSQPKTPKDAYTNNECLFLESCKCLILISENKFDLARDSISLIGCSIDIENILDTKKPHLSLTTAHVLSKVFLLIGKINMSTDIALQSFRFLANLGRYYSRKNDVEEKEESIFSTEKDSDDPFFNNSEKREISLFDPLNKNNLFRLQQVVFF